ncbi:unnamed protein product [Diamesa serratosioi]
MNNDIDLYGDFNEAEDATAGDNDNDNDDANNSDDPNDGQNDAVPVQPKEIKMKIKKKLFRLNPERLKSDRGVIAIDSFFKDIKFKGKGHEKHDLDDIMKRLEHWAHRLYPKYDLDDSLVTIEKMGKKKEIQMHMHRYRQDLLTPQSDEFVPSDKEDEMLDEQAPMDEFEALIDQQIALSTMAGISRLDNDSMNRSAMDAAFDNISGITSFSKAPVTDSQSNHEFEFNMLTQPNASQSKPEASQPNPVVTQKEQTRLSDELKARIAANKARAMALLETRKAEQKKQQEEEEAKRKFPTFQEISEVYIDDDFDL